MQLRAIKHQQLEWLLPVLAALITLAFAWYAWQNGDSVQLDVGTQTDVAAVDGFYDRERFEQETYRWGRENAQIRLPAVQGPAILSIRMAGRPGGTPMVIEVDGRPAAEFSVVAQQLRHYHMLWRSPQLSDETTIAFGAEEQSIPPEKRALTVLVEAARLTPTASAAGVPPLFVLLLFGLLGVLAYGIPRLCGANVLVAGVVGLIASGGMAYGWGQARIWFAPYLLIVVIGSAAIAGLLLALRAGMRSSSRLGPGALFACLVAASGLIPFYLALYTASDRQSVEWLGSLLLPLGLALLWAGGSAQSNAQPDKQASRPFWGIRILAACALITAYSYAALHVLDIFAHGIDLRGDFHALYRGAARLLYRTLPLYNLTAITANPFGNTYTAPPSLAPLLLPLAAQPLGQALAAWRIISLLLLIPIGGLLLAAYRLPLRSWPAAGLLLTLTIAPVVSMLGDGQIDILLLLLLTAALWALRAGRDSLVGVCFGIASALNPFIFFMLGFILVQRRWRALATALAALIIIVLATLAIVGRDAILTYIGAVLPTIGLSTSWIENQSLGGLINRLFQTDRIAAQPGLGGNIQTIIYGLGLAVLLLTGWLTRAGRIRADLAFGLWIVALLLALPTSWIHYQVLLIVPFFQAFMLAYEEELHWPAVACYTLAWMLIAQGDRMAFFDGVLLGPFWQLVLSYKLYGMLLLYGAMMLAQHPIQIKRTQTIGNEENVVSSHLPSTT